MGNIHASYSDFPPAHIPEPCRQPGNRRFAAAGRSHQSCDFALFCGKGNILQHGFPRVVGKAYMIESNIISLVGKLGISLLNRMIEDFIHTGDIGAGADNRRQILQRPLQRVVKP